MFVHSRKRHEVPGEEVSLKTRFCFARRVPAQDSDNSVCVKELKSTSFACGCNRDLVSSENPTPSPPADPDLLNEQAMLREFLDTIDSDDSDADVSSV